ncbi:MAG: hypothetical protein NT004_11090 [Bacteroidetes bacterium]|nr:hypothetical protein [Bacteroidota bacterium]
MYFEKLYYFDSWGTWGRVIRDAMRGFNQDYNLYPIYLLANSYTFSQIDFVGRHGTDPNMRPSDPKEKNAKISGIKFFDKEIAFGIEETIDDKYFLLLYTDELNDSDDGEDDPEILPTNDPIIRVLRNVRVQS